MTHLYHQLVASVLGAEILFVIACAVAVYLALWPAAWAWQSLRGNGPLGFLRLGLAALPVAGVVHVDGIKLWSRCTIPPFDGRARASAFVPKPPARAAASVLAASEASGGESPMGNAL